MRIQHNITALSAYRNLTNNNSAVAKNLEKLSSGYRINRAGDDAAGLAISEKMRAQITGLKTAQKNANDGISLVQTAEGAMTEVHSMLNRMVELATQSANGTYFDEDRANLQSEIQQLKDEINRIADSTNFNGINLLDGSMDAESTTTIDASSPISNITTADYNGGGVSDAFNATYVTNRPEAATKQTCAEFVVKLDDLAISAADAGKTSTVELTVGDATIKFTTADNTAQTTAALRTGLINGGCTATAGTDVADNAISGDTADKFTGVTNNGASGGGAYIKIDGNIYKMSAGAADNEIKFTQVNFMGNSGDTVNPDFEVNVKTTAGIGANATGTVNDHVQLTKQGVGVGSSHQAQVDVTIDFSKLKDGDTLTTGDRTYVFKIGENSTTAAPADSSQALVDLSTIFKTESDLANADKQAAAMVSITKQMGAEVPSTSSTPTAPTANKNNTWSVGNAGVTDGVGTLTFQSLSSYDGDTNAAHKVYIGGNSNNPVCDMRTEAEIMKQFIGNSNGNAASISFDLDVTKIKEGDTITIDGKTFEFTDGTHTSAKENIAVDLSSFNIANGILASETGNVMAALKTTLDGNFALTDNGNATTKFNVSFDGNTMKLVSKDLTDTSVIKEDRTAAKIELAQTAYAGKALTLQIGDTADSFNQLQVNVKDMHASAMGIGDIDISTIEGAKESIDKVRSAISYVSSTRGDLGAIQNRLEHTINNLSVTTENMTAAESRIRDVDMAEEMMAYTKNNILVQSAQAMLAQANQIPQGVLQLLQ